MTAPPTTAAATAAAATAAAALLLLLWALRPSLDATKSSAAPADVATDRELQRRLRRFGNTLPEADVPSWPLLGRVWAVGILYKIKARVGNAFNFNHLMVDSVAVGGSISRCYARLHNLALQELDSMEKNCAVPKTQRLWFPWMGKTENRGVAVLEYTQRLTFDVISVFLGGADPVHEAEIASFRDDIISISVGMGDLVLPRALPFTPFNTGMRAHARIAGIVKRLANNRRTRQEAGEFFPDMLGSMINTRQPNGNLLTDSEISDNVILILFAEYRTELQREIDGLEINDDGLPSEDALQSLPVLDAFMKEILRCKSPITGSYRQTMKSTDFDGSIVKPGTVLFVMTQATAFDPAFYPDPDAFDVSRFLPGGSALSAPSYSYIPFGAGPHMCLGMQLAKLEFKVFMFQMLRNYHVEAGSAKPVAEVYPIQRILSSVNIRFSDGADTAKEALENCPDPFRSILKALVSLLTFMANNYLQLVANQEAAAKLGFSCASAAHSIRDLLIGDQEAVASAAEDPAVARFDELIVEANDYVVKTLTPAASRHKQWLAKMTAATTVNSVKTKLENYDRDLMEQILQVSQAASLSVHSMLVVEERRDDEFYQRQLQAYIAEHVERLISALTAIKAISEDGGNTTPNRKADKVANIAVAVNTT
ncbi:hypothetical protein HK405_014681 [Cladochytrium tenue]|nr:hypothetical protein HK405_014681 [Cladochytrium tenue]